MSAAKVCDFCGEPCEGTASITIGEETRWYHHDDSERGPAGSCYEAAQWEMSGVRPDQRWIDELTMHEVYGDGTDT